MKQRIEEEYQKQSVAFKEAFAKNRSDMLEDLDGPKAASRQRRNNDDATRHLNLDSKDIQGQVIECVII